MSIWIRTQQGHLTTLCIALKWKEEPINHLLPIIYEMPNE